MSAMIFSADLVRLLDEGRRCRLPPTNVGVRRVREAPTTRRRGGEDDSAARAHDDAWAPNDVVVVAGRARGRTTDEDDYDHDDDDDDEGVRPDPRDARDEGGEGGGGGGAPRASARVARASSSAIVYRMTDPESGAPLGRRMTSREKKEMKLRLKTEARAARGEEKKRLHEERILEAKRGKAERLRSRRTARRGRTMMTGEKRGRGEEKETGAAETETETAVRATEDDHGGNARTLGGAFRRTDPTTRRSKITDDGETEERPSLSPGRSDADDDVAMTSNDRDEGGGSSTSVVDVMSNAGGRRCIPPAMLTPAATRVALDLGLLPSSSSPLDDEGLGVASEEQRYRQRWRQDRSIASSSSSSSPSSSSSTTTTAMDPALSAEWARRLQRSMVPAETVRAGEDMRPMAYRLVPEPWRRLCPDSLWTASSFAATSPSSPGEEGGEGEGRVGVVGGGLRCGDPKEEEEEDNTGEGEENESTRGDDDDGAAATARRIPWALVRVRDHPSSTTYDEDAYVVTAHLIRHSGLHVACGAAFGCDFLLYDGRREDRHSFAGLRVYRSICRRCGDEDEDEKGDRGRDGGDYYYDDSRHIDADATSECGGVVWFPMPSAYDLAGFVRTMNTARKIALVAMVARGGRGGSGGDDGDSATIAIVDLALEKVLTAHAHVRKGSTTKRRTEEDAASGLARKR